MAKYRGNAAVLLIAASEPAVTAIGGAMDYDAPNERETIDSTTNDDGDDDTHVTGHRSGTHTFKVFTDREDAGQNLLRTLDDAGGTYAFEYHPEGTGSGKPKHTFVASAVLKPGEPMRGLAVTNVTLKRSGALTKATQ